MAKIKNVGDSIADRTALRIFDSELGEAEAEWVAKKVLLDQEFAKNLNESLDIYSRLSVLTGDADVNRWLESGEASIDKRKMWGYKFVSATVVLCVIWWAFSGLYTDDGGKIDRYVTRVGEQKHVELPDGSRVFLNTASQILVDFGAERRVVVDRGEAFFEVVKDESSPFRVEVGDQSVSVLGTAFNIRKNSEIYSLSVIEGVVAIHATEETVYHQSPNVGVSDVDGFSGQKLVSKGWGVDYNTKTKLMKSVSLGAPEDVASWRNGFIHFDGEVLSKVIVELNRYSAKKIIIEDASLMELPVHATLRVDSLHSALLGLGESYEFEIRHHFDYVVIYSASE